MIRRQHKNSSRLRSEHHYQIMDHHGVENHPTVHDGTLYVSVVCCVARSPQLPAHTTDIRSFYQSAVLVGDGVIHLGDRTAELICDFTTNGPYPSSDILTVSA